MTVVIDDVVTTFSTRPDSHRSSWPRMQACVVRDLGYEVELGGDVSKADTWLVSTPMEFGGSYNLYGGFAGQPVEERVRRLVEFEGTLLGIGSPVPDVEAILRPRAEKEGSTITASEWEVIGRKCREADRVNLGSWVDVQRVVLGDSHSNARYGRHTAVLRNDGLTMHGLTEPGVIAKKLDEAEAQHVPLLVISAGNIDIRHHLCRYDAGAAWQLVQRLVDALQAVRDRFDNVEVTLPYPIEHEGRRIPKTGWYKGAPFTGTWAERDARRRQLDEALRANFSLVHEWPAEWYDLDPEEYAKQCMEKPGSVHLSPRVYPWDLDANEARWEP